MRGNNAAQGLNGDNSCLSISASYVTVDFGKKAITNTGAKPSAIGISTRKGVHTLLLEGRGATVSGWFDRIGKRKAFSLWEADMEGSLE